MVATLAMSSSRPSSRMSLAFCGPCSTKGTSNSITTALSNRHPPQTCSHLLDFHRNPWIKIQRLQGWPMVELPVVSKNKNSMLLCNSILLCYQTETLMLDQLLGSRDLLLFLRTHNTSSNRISSRMSELMARTRMPKINSSK